MNLNHRAQLHSYIFELSLVKIVENAKKKKKKAEFPKNVRGYRILFLRFGFCVTKFHPGAKQKVHICSLVLLKLCSKFRYIL